MKGRHTELSYEYSTEMSQYWRDCVVEAILYKVIKFEMQKKLFEYQNLNIKQIAVPDILSEDDSGNDSDTV